jgi:hypothetical protein
MRTFVLGSVAPVPAIPESKERLFFVHGERAAILRKNRDAIALDVECKLNTNVQELITVLKGHVNN